MSTIDTSNITSIYSEYAAQTAKDVQADKLKSVAKDAGSAATDKELMDACKQFEAYFLEQVFKQMSKTVNIGGTFNDQPTSNLVDFFKDNTIQELATKSTETNSLGLAQMLYEQMKRNVQGSDIPPAVEVKDTEA
ncbi:MAG: rod-binding protein [Lachnospiraceae bacterium]|nr:rod-binding protein [Lachnospiraceae bacterium]